MAREIVQLGQAQSRLPEQGRIRLGHKVATKTGKERPAKLKFFRLTSQDEGAIRQIAELYGGQAKPWANAPSGEQWEVFTLVNEIPIVLPPNPLGSGATYEEWGGGYVKRRCDGVTMLVPRPTEDGAEMAEEPCQCKANERLVCKVKTRLNVVLRDIRFGGTWRVETSGWYAFYELPGMVEMLLRLQGQGIMDGLLQLGEFTKVVQTTKGPATYKWMVPKLASPHSVAAIASGQAALGALGPAPTQELTAAPQAALDAAVDIGDGSDWVVGDDDIADAELVDDMDGALAGSDPASTVTAEPGGNGAPGGAEDGAPADSAPPPLEPDEGEIRERALKRMHALIRDVRAKCDARVSADDWRHGMVAAITKGAKSSSGTLTDDELRVLIDVLEDLKEGRRRYINYDSMRKRVMMTQRKEVT